ncbi:hypothetical protein [Saccharopolyspora mangrovi]|uniref:Uncharacterized protein n=1 Tax=Saccharopolyspora mangrovi TaxID=3082379 RepID=A0ABU6AMA7_9PSEU|nr:hypothetical protein [Saccharopolyspora sp. S2-29]MEB3372435.1 hypothetical protein [Saccharopolyspora sp. S2-29]
MFTELTDLIDDVHRELAPVFDMMEWAEDEISAARRRHPAHADTLHHSFALLTPTSDRMRTEFVYRGHARELLDRVAQGEDTRPATAAEIVLAFCHASQTAPLNTTATGLVFRMWQEAFPDTPVDIDDQEHREQLYGSSIDDAEADTRARLADSSRVLGTIECGGWHHGEPVACSYAPYPHLGQNTA